MQRQTGTAAMLIAAALLVLLAFAALAIDAGLGYDERRDLQNAADNAAYAAAYEDCDPQYDDTTLSNPLKAARFVAAENGFTHDPPSVTVEAAATGSDEWTVTITVTDLATTFGRATPYAGDALTVTAAATARCKPNPFLGGYAVFAGSDACSQNELDISGDDVSIVGKVHTNEDIKVTGSSPSISGEITYVPPGTANLSGSLTASTTQTQSYPLDPNLIVEYRPGGARTTASYHQVPAGARNADFIAAGYGAGNQTSIQLTTGGIYYSPGGIELKGVTLAPGVAITLVAEGHIEVIADGDITGFDPIDPANPNSTKMTAFSWNVEPTTCSPGPASAVTVSASSMTWTGLIFAPNGLVRFSASSATTIDGSIIAYTINLSGSELSVFYDDTANADPEFILELVR
jgi:hypothetical protein